MAINQQYTLKRGEVGTLLQATLSDDNGTVNLNGWTVTMTVKKGSNTAVVDEAVCTVVAGQPSSNKGKIEYEWDATTANIPAGDYNLEFKAVNPTSDVYYFPKHPKEPYAILHVIEPLS